jgi:hypothetical protein
MHTPSEADSDEHTEHASSFAKRSKTQSTSIVSCRGAHIGDERQRCSVRGGHCNATVTVNAYGGLVLLKTAVRLGQRLKIKNLNTGEETACVAVDANAGTSEAREVGVEFTADAPKFWRISFPPANWNSRGPEAKRFGQASPVQESGPSLSAKK